MNVAVWAGALSTALFVGSYLPMLVKAKRTKDLDSYSRGNLVLATVGNAIYSVYVVSLPLGPIWFLHTFYVASTLAMLLWHVRYAAGQAGPASSEAQGPGSEALTRCGCP